MIDYLDSVLPAPELSFNLNEISNFFSELDKNTYWNGYNKLDNLIIQNSKFFIFTKYEDFNIKGLIKMDEIDKAFLIRDENYNIIKTQLIDFQSKILLIKDSKKRDVMKKRMKKLLKLAIDLEDDLNNYKISIESHNTVLVYNYLKLGLYPTTDYDIECNLFLNYNLIIYDEYLYFLSYIDETEKEMCQVDYYIDRINI